VLVALLLLAAATSMAADEAAIRRLISRGGDVRLPSGSVTISREIAVPAGTTVTGKYTTLRMARGFRGRAALVCGSRVTVQNLIIYGNREEAPVRVEIAPYDRSFVSFYARNGIIAENVEALTIRNVEMSGIAGFAIIVAASKNVQIERVRVFDSGSLNGKGRNNTSGGILLEEGTAEFSVRYCDLRRIRGNGIWTHSRYESRRNGPGVMTDNSFQEIGRDALQAGHATGIRIENNKGRRIGWPVEVVDVEGGGTPVAIDTAGDVDKSSYAGNLFEEINGKCIDLDGFHDGEVRGNTCINRGQASDYPFGNFGIAFNNTNPDMRSERVRVVDNTIDGAKFGGIFVVGRQHEIRRNTLVRLNLARCNDTPGCVYDASQPDFLRSGIYLAAKAERPDPARENVVTGNKVSGHGMDRFCIVAAPGAGLDQQAEIGNNECKSQ
jgi:hypothetical protein